MPRTGAPTISAVTLRSATQSAGLRRPHRWRSLISPRLACPRARFFLGGRPSLQHRETELFARLEIRLRHQAREIADARDVGGALGNGDRAARIEQIKHMSGLEYQFVTR